MSDDSLMKFIAASCYGKKPVEFTKVFREMMRSYQTTGESNTTATEYYSQQVIDCVGTIRKIDKTGLYDVYEFHTFDNKTYYIQWQELLAKGSYNHVYKAVLETGCKNVGCSQKRHNPKPAVVKITLQPVKDLRVYLMENIIHAILCRHPDSQPYVVPMYFPFKRKRADFPKYELGCVFADPGLGDLSTFVEKGNVTDSVMFALLTQVAFIMYVLQKTLVLQHRDLKADNIMLGHNKKSTMHICIPEHNINFVCPTYGMQCLLIDFGMTRMEIAGEYVACDVVHRDLNFNPCHDMQFFLSTTHDDCADVLHERAPVFFKWLVDYTEQIRTRIQYRWRMKHATNDAQRNFYQSEVTEKERLNQYAPVEVLKVIQAKWDK
jgi:serine/threonine protein kinase